MVGSDGLPLLDESCESIKAGVAPPVPATPMPPAPGIKGSPDEVANFEGSFPSVAKPSGSPNVETIAQTAGEVLAQAEVTEGCGIGCRHCAAPLVAGSTRTPSAQSARLTKAGVGFNADGFGSLCLKYFGGRPTIFPLLERREIKKIAKFKPIKHDFPFSTWRLTILVEFLVAEGVVDDIGPKGLCILLRRKDASRQHLPTWKTSHDPDNAAKKARLGHLYAIVDREVIREDGDPDVIFCMDDLGPLNRKPQR
ncbi:hypothetical protein [Streptomyces fructofermentans]|uniref:hypothetical protein n=1 Tax=Streptomyces fructofermentans TaxID=152141 RepID=UPI003F4D04F5